MTEPTRIGPETVVARNEEPVAVEVDRTVVMLSIAQGMYFGLEGVAPRIWALLEQPRSVAELCKDLTDEFDVQAAECRRDVCEFLEELRRADLVRVHDTSTDTVRQTPGS